MRKIVLLIFFLTFLVALFFKPSNATAISSAGLAGVDAVAFFCGGVFVCRVWYSQEFWAIYDDALEFAASNRFPL